MRFYEKVYYLSHELCHYIAARLLGIEAELHITYVRTWPKDSVWRDTIVTLAPSIFGLLTWGIMIWVDYNKGLYYLTVCGFILNLWWQYTCKGDYKQVWAKFANNDPTGRNDQGGGSGW